MLLASYSPTLLISPQFHFASDRYGIAILLLNTNQAVISLINAQLHGDLNLCLVCRMAPWSFGELARQSSTGF